MRDAGLRSDRRNVDHAGLPSPAKMRQRRQRRVHRAPEHHIHRLFEIGDRHRLYRAYLNHARIVHHHVEPPIPGDHGGDHVPYLRFIADVAHHGQHVRAAVRQIAFRYLQFVPVARADRDRRSVLRERARERQSKTPRSACNQDNLPGQIQRIPPVPHRRGYARNHRRRSDHQGPPLHCSVHGSALPPVRSITDPVT